MSPDGQTRGKKIKIPDNIYTAVLAAACALVLAAAIFVTIMCYRRYGTLFTIP